MIWQDCYRQYYYHTCHPMEDYLVTNPKGVNIFTVCAKGIVNSAIDVLMLLRITQWPKGQYATMHRVPHETTRYSCHILHQTFDICMFIYIYIYMLLWYLEIHNTFTLDLMKMKLWKKNEITGTVVIVFSKLHFTVSHTLNHFQETYIWIRKFEGPICCLFPDIW